MAMIAKNHMATGGHLILRPASSKIDNTTSVSIYFYTDEGYIFKDIPYLTYTKNDGSTETLNFPLLNNTKSETITYIFSDCDLTKEVGFYGNVEKNYKTYPIQTILQNCQATGIPEYWVLDYKPVNIVITANNGFSFKETPYIKYPDPYGWEAFADFELSDDGKTATFNGTLGEICDPEYGCVEDFTMEINAVAESEQGEVGDIKTRYGTLNVYKLNDRQIDEFCGKRFDYGLSGDEVVRIDLGNYVNRIRRVFFPVGETVDATIVCGNVDTQVEAQAITKDLQTLDFGEVEIPQPNQDITDYNSRISVFLPFVGFVELSSAYIGKTVKLVYDVNTVTGEGVAKLACDGVTFALYPCTPSTEIMFKTNEQTATLGSAEFTSQFLYGFTPYVLLYWNTSKNERYVNSDCVRTVIGDFTGYAKFNELTDLNNGQITAEEKNMILRVLNNGVYIEPTENED